MPMFEIVRSNNETDRITDFIAIGNLVNKTNSTHSAFVIQYDNSLYEFHYTGQKIEYNRVKRDYYHKITETVLPDEVPAFIAQCKNILKKANPRYGFFYSGESYDINGNHQCNTDLGEVMTCVGFCLNVLKGFLEEDYLVFSDWTNETHDSIGYIETFCTNNKLDSSKISASHRRITPRECLTSCFFTKLPITKKEIDDKVGEVDEYFLVNYSISNN